jgi:aryl-alcohol dehydrogenase-like predicted oxidoreductase
MVDMQHRTSFPKASQRLPLRPTGLSVSPLCIGITGTPNTIVSAYEAGVNFFLLSCDLHWPLYEQTRLGLARLLKDNRARRDEIVVAGVSYLDEPMFRYLQFQEIVDSVPGLQRIDVLLAGAVSSDASFAKIGWLQKARSQNHVGCSGIGATFHAKRFSLAANLESLIDIHYIRYNTGHPGARKDLFPHFRPDRSHLTFNFKSTMFRVSEERFRALGLSSDLWIPKPSDYYRFAMTHPTVDGILCSPQTPEELAELTQALEERPLTPDEEEYMIWLSCAAYSAGGAPPNPRFPSETGF